MRSGLLIDMETGNVEELKDALEMIQRRIYLLEQERKEFNIHERILVAVIDDLITKIGKTVPVSDIIDESNRFNLSEKEVSKAMTGLKKKGIIFEVRTGFIQKI